MNTMNYVHEANARYASASTEKQRNKVLKKFGCKGTHALLQLSGHDHLLMTPPNPMHLLKNIAEHIVSLICSKEDSRKVCLVEQTIGRFETAWIQHDSKFLPPAPFILSASERRLLMLARACVVRLPTGFDWRPRSFFSKSSAMKSHEWMQVMCNGIFKFRFQGLLGRAQHTTLLMRCMYYLVCVKGRSAMLL